MSAAADTAILAPRAIRHSPLPRRWAKRGQFTDLAGLDDIALLARVFGLEGTALPPAPLHYLGTSGREPSGYCLFAYPVHLHARREQLILMAGPDFEPREAEAEHLVAELHEHFDDWRIERTPDGMWFLLLDDDPQMETTPLHEALGENIHDHLPRGADAMSWHRIMNELQMVLFDSEVNQRRESAGEPTLNSLWFWGGGRLPAVPAVRWTRLVSNDPVARGLGLRANIETRTPAQVPDMAVPGTLWVHAAGPASQGEAPAVPSRDQWRALEEALRQSTIGGLVLLEPGYGELRIDASSARSWWPWS